VADRRALVSQPFVRQTPPTSKKIVAKSVIGRSSRRADGRLHAFAEMSQGSLEITTQVHVQDAASHFNEPSMMPLSQFTKS
jgi:hypothetical protein